MLKRRRTGTGYKRSGYHKSGPPRRKLLSKRKAVPVAVKQYVNREIVKADEKVIKYRTTNGDTGTLQTSYPLTNNVVGSFARFTVKTPDTSAAGAEYMYLALPVSAVDHGDQVFARRGDTLNLLSTFCKFRIAPIVPSGPVPPQTELRGGLRVMLVQCTAESPGLNPAFDEILAGFTDPQAPQNLWRGRNADFKVLKDIKFDGSIFPTKHWIEFRNTAYVPTVPIPVGSGQFIAQEGPYTNDYEVTAVPVSRSLSFDSKKAKSKPDTIKFKRASNQTENGSLYWLFVMESGPDSFQVTNRIRLETQTKSVFV